jgi:hypothetical protein
MAKQYDVGTGGRRLPGEEFRWQHEYYNPLTADERTRLFQQALQAAGGLAELSTKEQVARIAADAQAGAKGSDEEKLLGLWAQAQMAKPGANVPAIMAEYKQRVAASKGAAPGQATQAAGVTPVGFIDPEAMATLGKTDPKTGIVTPPTGAQLAAFMGKVPENFAPEARDALIRRFAATYGTEETGRNVLESRLDDLMRSLSMSQVGTYTRTPGPGRRPTTSALTSPYRSTTYTRPFLDWATPDRPAWTRTASGTGELTAEAQAIERLLRLLSQGDAPAAVGR